MFLTVETWALQRWHCFFPDQQGSVTDANTIGRF
jgi:hypothetical protein